MESRKCGPRECVDYEAQIEAVKAEMAEYERSLETEGSYFQLRLEM